MKTEIVKNGKGHDIYVDGGWVMWVTGSIKNANKELDKYLKQN